MIRFLFLLFIFGGILSDVDELRSEDYVKRVHNVTLNHAHKGTLEVDTLLLDSFGAPPQNIREFYLLSREILSEDIHIDYTNDGILNAAKKNNVALLGGPMLGDLTSSSVMVWVLPSQKMPITISLKNSKTGDIKKYGKSDIHAGIAARVKLDKLLPLSHYSYDVYVGDMKVAKGSFTTAPRNQYKGVTRIAFGADFHKIGLHNPNLYREIQKRDPLVMLFYGDTAVDGRKNNINMHRADYLLRNVSLPWNAFVANRPVYATWDDWDYFTNDTSGIPKSFTAVDREAVRKVWHDNWVNPVGNPKRDGIYFSTRIGPVEVFMLDTRSCRENKRRGEYMSYLGKTQHEWLKKGLKESTAPFKVISSGTMWSDYVSKAKDSWGIWDIQGREDIFGHIEDNNISGVLLISGDRHGARGFKIPRESNFNFYEFEVGTLGGVPGPGALVKDCPEQLFGYEGIKTIAFGEFTFDTSIPDPTVTFRLISDTGKILETYKFSQSTLTK